MTRDKPIHYAKYSTGIYCAYREPKTAFLTSPDPKRVTCRKCLDKLKKMRHRA